MDCCDMTYSCCFRRDEGCLILKGEVKPPCRFAKKTIGSRPYVLGGSKLGGRMKIEVMLDDGAIMPTRAHTTDAGLDLYSPDRIFLRSGTSWTIDTGVHVLIPEGYVGMLKSKSGLNVKYGLSGEGVIDAGYTGAIICKLYNHGEKDYCIERGDKIIQLVILPIITPEPVLVDAFPDTDRGNNGFGSTGRS